MNDVPNQYQNNIENKNCNNNIFFESNNIRNVKTSSKKEEELSGEIEEVGVALNLEPLTLPDVPGYTVKRVKMDGSCVRGIDRRLFSSHTRMIKRFSGGSEGTTLVCTDASKVSADVILCFEFVFNLLFCRFTLLYCIKFDSVRIKKDPMFVPQYVHTSIYLYVRLYLWHVFLQSCCLCRQNVFQ